MSKVDIPFTVPAEAMADLAQGAHRRLTAAAWRAKGTCERIAYNDADPIAEIAEARRALDEAERHARAFKAYRGEAGGPPA